EPDGRVALDGVVEVGFTAPVAEGDWYLSVHGLPGQAALSDDGLRAVFTPTSPWLPERTYQLEAGACETTQAHPFVTLPNAVSPAQLEGRTWRFDTSTAEWVTPGISDLFAGLIGIDDLLVTTRERSDGLHLEVRPAMRMGSTTLPIPCVALTDIGVLDFTASPRLSTPAKDVQVDLFGQDVRLGQVSVEAIAGSDGGRLESIQIDATLDMRDVEALTGLTGLCTITQRLGEPCTTCPDGADACLSAYVLATEALEVFDVDPTSPGWDLFGLCP
ncbi:MAG: hypothetical protein KC656_33335, partial [Myxococcales bacterium]|nr:hypothetical protein [Myxococcales bacterium]